MTLFISNYTTVFSIVFLLLAVSFILSIGLMVYSFRVHANKEASTFGLVMLVISLWVMFKLLALFVDSVEVREFMHKINILLIVLITPLLLIVSVFHTNFPGWFKQNHIRMLFIFPALIYLFVFISGNYNFLYAEFRIIDVYGIPVHVFKKLLLYRFLDIYNYILIVGAFIILFKSLARTQKYFRKQIILFIIGLLIPIVYDVLYILGYSPIANYNLSPVFVSVGNCFLSWSMFGYRFFKLIPVAHHVVVDNMNDVMIVVSESDLIVDINKSGEELFGIKKQEIMGEDFNKVFKAYPQLINKFKNPGGINEIAITQQNKTNYYSLSFSNFGGDSQSQATIILMHDITGRINIEKQVKKLSVAIEQSPVTIVITDIEGNIEYVNPAFCNVTGYTENEAIGNNPRVLKGHTPKETFTDLWETILAGKVWKGEFINRKKSGELYFEEATIAPVKNDQDEIVNFIAIKDDISYQKETEKKIQKQNDELKALNATKDKFFSIIAHDLRSPFNAIVGYSDFVIENIEELDKEKIKLYTSYISISANQTLRLLENLLEWSRINRGLVKPGIKQHFIKFIAEESIQLNSDQARSKSIELQNQVSPDLLINCDLDMMKTILRNLVSNAVKFTPPGGTVIISAYPERENVILKISDTGNGIPAENIPFLFSIENNLSTPGTENEKGTGLGLPLCKELIELQGGSIYVESTVNKGSTFSILIPAGNA